jgi:hypothetical protein
VLLFHLACNQLIVGLAGVLEENHVDLPDLSLVSVRVHLLLDEARARFKEFKEADGVDEEAVVDAVDFFDRHADAD